MFIVRIKWASTVRKHVWVLAQCSVLSVLFFDYAHALQLRGVDPSKASLYKGSQSFVCDSGHKVIQIKQVNDNYCDCDDGSDEPGTSACANGSFFCANRGYKPLRLSSIFVDDGICDCCDGTDEESGCSNTCESIGALARQQAQAALEQCESGVVARARLVKHSHKKKHHWSARIKELEPLVSQLEAEVKELEDTKNRAQERQDEAERAQKEAAKRKEDLVSDSQDDSHSDNGDGKRTGESSRAEPEDITESDVPVEQYEEDPRDEIEDSEDPDAVAKRIAAQWTNDPSATGHPPPSEDVPRSSDEGSPVKEPSVAPNQKRKSSFFSRLSETVKSFSGTARPSATSGNHPTVEDLTEASKQAVLALNTKQKQLRDSQNELKLLSKLQQQDYGLDQVFAALTDECHEVVVEKYKYRLCHFDNASQNEGSSSTSLGRFSSCEDNCSIMKYTNSSSSQNPRSYSTRRRSSYMYSVWNIKNFLASLRSEAE